MIKAEAVVTIVDRHDPDDPGTRHRGRYWGDGRMACYLEDHILVIDPENYNETDPKRLLNHNTGSWTKFRVKSVVLKTGNSTSIQT